MTEFDRQYCNPLIIFMFNQDLYMNDFNEGS